jgi:hypothetical protein
VIQHGSVSFQSFTFSTRLLQRTIDQRRVCFINIPEECDNLMYYIDTVSTPYTRHHHDYYHRDRTTVIVEYNEDIGKTMNLFIEVFPLMLICVELLTYVVSSLVVVKDFAKISFNVRNHAHRHDLSIECIQLHRPETLLVEYDRALSDNDLKILFDKQRIFHIKTYSTCAFVHFYSHCGMSSIGYFSLSIDLCSSNIYNK